MRRQRNGPRFRLVFISMICYKRMYFSGDKNVMVAQEKIGEAAKILSEMARPHKIILFGS